jgi:hypothetical protein
MFPEYHTCTNTSNVVGTGISNFVYFIEKTMLSLESKIEQLKRDAIETTSPNDWRTVLSDKIKVLFPSNQFSEEHLAYILSDIERNVVSFFKPFDNMELTQKDYEKLKQTRHDCLSTKRMSFIFSKTEEYGEMSIERARLLIKYLEINNKVELYQPKETEKFHLSYEQHTGVLQNERGLKISPSRSMISVYKPDVQLIPNVHFFIRPCPVCSRYAEAYATLSWCPECNEHEYIAYPNTNIDDMMTPIYDYDEDDFPTRSNGRYGHSDWSDDDIDDIFEGDPDNSLNTE